MEGYREFLRTFMTPEVAKMMERNPFMIDTYKSMAKKYRCKVCGKYETKRSDVRRVCPSCRQEYLEGKNE